MATQTHDAPTVPTTTRETPPGVRPPRTWGSVLRYIGIAVANFQHVVSEFSVSITLWACESIVIDFRLVMMMRRVAGPATGVIDNFAENQVGLGPCRAVEDQPDIAEACSLDEPRTTILGFQVGWSKQQRRKASIV